MSIHDTCIFLLGKLKHEHFMYYLKLSTFMYRVGNDARLMVEST